MNIIKRNIPNAVTCLNVLSGTLAIIAATHHDTMLWGLSGQSWAYIMIGVAAIADFCDGFMARLLHAYSDLGKELDSLCDLVSFGVAPAMILFESLGDRPDSWVRWVALLIPVCGALRLAKFNIDTRQSVNFIGLPIPANAIFWIGYTAMISAGATLLSVWWVALPVILIESWLMISELPLPSLKFKTWGWKGNGARWSLIIMAVVFTACMGVAGLMWLIVAYILMGVAATFK